MLDCIRGLFIYDLVVLGQLVRLLKPLKLAALLAPNL